MKKNILRFTSVILLVSMMFLFSACALFKPSGTYKSTGTVGGAIGESFTFSGKDSVVVSALGLNVSGTYKISGDEITITYSILGISTSATYSYEKKGNTLYIDGKEFVKE